MGPIFRPFKFLEKKKQVTIQLLQHAKLILTMPQTPTSDF